MEFEKDEFMSLRTLISLLICFGVVRSVCEFVVVIEEINVVASDAFP